MSKIKLIPFTALTIYAPGDEDKYANLSWSIRNGYPRITVYTENTKGVKTPFDYNKLITAPFDAVTINILITYAGEVIKSDKPIKKSIKCFNIKYVNNEKTNDITLQATVHIGKGDDGVIYIAVIAEGKKKVKFNLLPNSKWHKLVDGDGDEITDLKVLSNYHAKAYFARLTALVDKYVVTDDVIKVTEPANSNSDII